MSKLNAILKLKAFQSKISKHSLSSGEKKEKQGYPNLETEREGREDTDRRLTNGRPLLEEKKRNEGDQKVKGNLHDAAL